MVKHQRASLKNAWRHTVPPEQHSGDASGTEMRLATIARSDGKTARSCPVRSLTQILAGPDTYAKLHRLGYTHSAESWLEGKLAGGLYGVSPGNGADAWPRSRFLAALAEAMHHPMRSGPWRFDPQG